MKIIDFIKALRDSDPYIKTIFMHGSCYRFYLMTKKLFPEALPYINKNKDHIAVKYSNRFYDITGLIKKGDFSSLQKEDLKEVEKWSFNKTSVIKLGDCPHCEEPLLI